MTKSTATAFQGLCEHFRQVAKLASIEELLGWDERTMMPDQAGAFRAEQMTLLAGLVHQQRTDPRVGDWLQVLSDDQDKNDPHGDQSATIRQLKRDYDRQVKMPQKLVEDLTRQSVLGQQAWDVARRDNHFAHFRPHLEKLIHLKQQQADALGYPECRYDALLDEYEPEATTSQVAQVLEALRQDLVPLVAAIGGSGKQAPVEVLQRSYPVAVQQQFGRAAAQAIGFDFQSGRLDVAHHPFCTSLGPRDCRITTRYDERFFPSAFFSILHEAGHGIYEQGLQHDWFGLPLGSFVSLGIHESQSRLWENFVGRGPSFWKHFFPQLRQAFPAALEEVALETFLFAVNDVRPSLIRVEADEATYNLHIILRFELEQQLIHDELKVTDLPDAWNAKYEQYLGIQPPNDAQGVLQDIHWSAALFGYFPTYSLGNVYAAQFYEAAKSAIGGLEDEFARGNFAPLTDWLRDNLHRHGQRYTATELVHRTTGGPLRHQPLIAHLRNKLGPLYGIAG